MDGPIDPSFQNVVGHCYTMVVGGSARHTYIGVISLDMFDSFYATYEKQRSP